jgi:hypothetical protein
MYRILMPSLCVFNKTVEYGDKVKVKMTWDRLTCTVSVSQSTDYVKCIYYDLGIRSLCLGQLFIYFVLRKQDCQALNIISPIMDQMC